MSIKTPKQPRDLQIVATPTLVKFLPEPLRRIIGDLSNNDSVLAGLNLHPSSQTVDRSLSRTAS